MRARFARFSIAAWKNHRKLAASSGAAVSLTCSQQVRCTSSKPRQDASSPGLSAFGLGDIPTEAYKTHFKTSYDNAADKSVANVARRRDDIGADHQEPEGDREVRLSIARYLMTRLGYSEEELAFIGEDVLRMQGVGSPFRALAPRDGETVLDLGSGFGIDSFLAARKVGSNGRVIGVDLSAEEVSRADKRAHERGLDQRCCFVKGDVEDLPLEASSVDTVISNGAFCLCPSKKKAFQEVHRVLKPGGRISVSCTVLQKPLPALKDKRWPPCMEVFMLKSDIKELLHSIGYAAVTVDDSNARMDVWDLGDSELESVAKSLSGKQMDPSMMGCSHAQKAAARRAKQAVEGYLSKDREVGIHWGNPEFAHIKEYDMDEYCQRVIIYAEKLT